MTNSSKPEDRELKTALAHHLAGRLDDAERLYKAILVSRPDHADALHLIGVAEVQFGNAATAIGWIARAIEINPKVAAYHSNFAKALSDVGRLAEAGESCAQALAIDPDYVDAHVNLGFVHNRLGETDKAIASFRQALSLKPDHAEARVNLGAVLCQAGQLDEAGAEYSALLLQNPKATGAYLGLGAIRHEQRRFAEAARLHREAVRLAPTSVEALSNLGITLLELGRLDEAETACRKALRLNPKFAAAHSNLGLILTELGAFEEGEEHLRQALALTPDHERSLANLANALVEQGRFGEALDCYRDIVRLHPDSADAKANLGIMLLRSGDFAEGWRFYQSRRDVRGLTEFYRHRAGSIAPWSGEFAPERLLIVHAEQGFGDVIQFCRYLSMAAERVRVIVQAPATLHRLLVMLPGVECVVEPGHDIIADFYCSMLSLPFLLGTTLESIPATMPYLQGDAAAVRLWRARLSGMPGLKVGLAWSGRSTLRHDHRRSIDPALFAGVLKTPGVSFVSLQKDDERRRPRDLPDWTEELADFADTASLIETLDLVIAVDTAVAHLAGALGKPVWLLNRFAPDWRWMLGRDDSPWYPSLRQFRQAKPDDWTSVLERVAAELQRVTAEEEIRF